MNRYYREIPEEDYQQHRISAHILHAKVGTGGTEPPESSPYWHFVFDGHVEEQRGLGDPADTDTSIRTALRGWADRKIAALGAANSPQDS